MGVGIKREVDGVVRLQMISHRIVRDCANCDRGKSVPLFLNRETFNPPELPKEKCQMPSHLSRTRTSCHEPVVVDKVAYRVA